jgi:hypothetical protein
MEAHETAVIEMRRRVKEGGPCEHGAGKVRMYTACQQSGHVCIRCGRFTCARHSDAFWADKRFRVCRSCPPAAMELDREERKPTYRSGKVVVPGPEALERLLSNREWKGSTVEQKHYVNAKSVVEVRHKSGAVARIAVENAR